MRVFVFYFQTFLKGSSLSGSEFSPRESLGGKKSEFLIHAAENSEEPEGQIKTTFTIHQPASDSPEAEGGFQFKDRDLY